MRLWTPRWRQSAPDVAAAKSKSGQAQNTQRRSVREVLGDVDAAVTWCDGLLAAGGYDDDMRYAAQVCLEEALANLIMHAVARRGSKEIEIELDLWPDRARMSITDACFPFDPTSGPALRRKEGIGGNGIRLIREFASDLTYTQSRKRNRLDITLRPGPGKALDKPSAPASAEPTPADRIRGVAVLSSLPDRGVTYLLENSSSVTFAPGDILVKQTDQSTSAFIVLSGNIEVVNESGHGETILARTAAPLMLGEIGALADLPRTATVRAATSVTALRIERGPLLALCRLATQVPLSVIGRLGEQINGVNRALGLYARGLSALEQDDFDPALIADLKNPTSEVRDFADAFKRLANRIALERQKRSEMASAAVIQRSFLPQTLDSVDASGRCDVFGDMTPARDVGGDFYDAFMLDDRRLVLIIGDVCGKGVPASLFMSFAMTVIRSIAGHEHDLSSLINRANHLLYEQNAASMFATLSCCIIDLVSGDLDYVSCGHPPCYIVRKSGVVEELAGGGTPLGIFPERRTMTHRLRVEPGDCIFLYTDGITESHSTLNEEYGAERLTAVLSETAVVSARDVIARVLASVAIFAEGAEQFDDITCLAAVVKPPTIT